MQVLDAGLGTLDSGLWALDPGCWTTDSGLWALDSEPWNLIYLFIFYLFNIGKKIYKVYRKNSFSIKWNAN